MHGDFTLLRTIILAVLDVPDEHDSLSHYNECPRLHNLFLSFWRHATMVPQRNNLLHDLISRVFLRSLQYGIVVLGFLDAFVYAQHKHCRDPANAGNFGDCMSGRVRFMTAITPAYAHAYQSTVIVEIWVTNALIMLLHLAFFGSSLATTSPRVGLDTTLTLPNVSKSATVSVKFLNDSSTFEQKLRYHTRTGFSIGISHRVPCVLCSPYVCYCHVSHLLSSFCLFSLWIVFPTSGGPTFFIRVYCIEY